jgi:chemotaxis protein histidine kinase CheA
MDWAESEELMGIYFTEVDQRSESLIKGAEALIGGTCDPAIHDDLVRDAHTLKGSSHMVGKPEVGEASAVLERAWKAVRDSAPSNTSELGAAMLELTRMLQSAAREPQGSEASPLRSEPSSRPSPTTTRSLRRRTPDTVGPAEKPFAVDRVRPWKAPSPDPRRSPTSRWPTSWRLPSPDPSAFRAPPSPASRRSGHPRRAAAVARR